MNGAHRIQEIKYFRGGATLVFSLDGLQHNWLSERGRGDGGRRCIEKKDEELRFWIPPGGATQADEEPHPITCLCIRGQRGTAAPWGNNRPKPPPPRSAPPQHCCLLGQSQPFHHSTVTSAASITNTLVFEAPWTRIIFRKRDIFSWFPEDLKVATQRDIVTMDQHKVFIILCDEDCSMPPELLGDIYYKEDGGKTSGIISCRVNDTSDASGDLKARPPPGPRVDSSEGCQPQTIAADSFNTLKLKSLLKSSRSCESPGRDGGGVKRKCVSFVDDVTVYLFDQESPTMELQRHSPEGCPSPPCSFPYALPDLTVDDSGLEWEDDFSALDWAKRNCHQCVTHSGPRELPVSHRRPPALPTRSRTFFLSQTCLFLTYVTESDLEL